MRDSVSEKIRRETESGYNQIAKKFSETRKYFWSDLLWLADLVKNGDIVLDFGCGNGRLRNLLVDKEIEYVGVDISDELLKEARKKIVFTQENFKKISAGETSLAFSGENFNVIFSIATFHHLPGKKYRQQMAAELYRVLRKEGRLVVTVWNLRQRKYLKYLWRNWWRKLKGKSQLDWSDCYIPFKDNEGNVFWRYHHAFSQRSLKKLFEEVGFRKISVRKVGGNLVLVGKK